MDKSTHFVFFFQNTTWLKRFKTEVPPKWCETWEEGGEIKSASLNQGAHSEHLNFPRITSTSLKLYFERNHARQIYLRCSHQGIIYFSVSHRCMESDTGEKK